jgi:demethylmenaquinone methyltransferase/2-methoxy-6-polyprenyl-1,4-benzoquinol methylase
MCTIMPKYSRLFTTEEGAYQYLGPSIQRFPNQPKLAAMMVEAGFSSASWTNYALGIVAVHIAQV